MEEEEGRAGLRELARMPDVLVVCSSAGWTDHKHMLYLALLQESFVNQLHDGQIGFKGLLGLSPGASRPTKQSAKVYTAKPPVCVKAEQSGPPCCEHQGEDGDAHSMDDDASSIDTAQESSYKASATSSGRSSPCHFGKRGRSPSRTAEGSDQNFIDEDAIAGEIGESRGRRRSNKRPKIC